MPEKLFGKYAKYFKHVSHGYRRETKFVQKMVNKHKKTSGNDMIVFACGSGPHDKYLKKDFSIMGVDRSLEMIKLAKKNNPTASYRVGDMRKFRTKKKFDVVLCLDSVWYNRTYRDLRNTFQTFARHTKKGGILIFSLYPWKDNFEKNAINVDRYDGDDLNIMLFNVDYVPEKNRTEYDSVFVILMKKNGRGVKVEVDTHKLGMFHLARVKNMLRKLGYKIHLYEIDFSGDKFYKDPAIFVCVKK